MDYNLIKQGTCLKLEIKVPTTVVDNKLNIK